MKLKRILSATLAAAMIFGLTACDDEGGSPAPSTTDSAAATTTTGTTAATTPVTLKEEEAEKVAGIELEAKELKNPTVKFLSSWDINPTEGKPMPVELELFQTKYGGKIEYVACTWDDRYDKLCALVQAGDSPDMFSAADLDVFPKGAINKMFEPLDDYVDFNSELWAPMKEINEQFVYNGKHYVGATATDAGVVMIYNTRVFEENNLTDPRDLLADGNWNWDTFNDLMIEFCDRDQQKFAVDGWWFEGAFSLTTGVPYIGMKDGKVVNNLNDPMVEKVQEFMFNMKKQDLPFPKSEYQWQIYQTNIGDGKTLFWPCGMWSLYTPDLSPFGKIEEIAFVPMPKCPYTEEYYLPTAIDGFSLCKGSENGEGVAAYLNCRMVIRDNEEAKQIAKDQLFENYGWTEDMWDMLQVAKEYTAQHPVIEFYGAVSAELNDLVNNPMKQSYNAGESWTQTKETINMSVQSEVDKANAKLQ